MHPLGHTGSVLGSLYLYPIITTICFIALLVDRYNGRLLPLLKKFLLVQNRNNKFMDLIANCSTPCFNPFCRVLIYTWWLENFNFSIAKSTSKALASVTRGSAVCISVCLRSLKPCTFDGWEKNSSTYPNYCGSLQTNTLPIILVLGQ